MDLTDKLKAGRNALEELVSRIPGFEGYKEKEIRRDADHLVRQHVTRLLQGQHGRLSGLQVELLEAGKFDLLDDIERVGTKVLAVINRLKTASYGYAGLFDAVKVQEEQLEALYRFDHGLLRNVDEIQDAIDQVAEAVRSGEDLADPLRSLKSVTEELTTAVRGREEAVLGDGLSGSADGLPSTES